MSFPALTRATTTTQPLAPHRCTASLAFAGMALFTENNRLLLSKNELNIIAQSAPRAIHLKAEVERMDDMIATREEFVRDTEVRALASNRRHTP